MSRTAALISGQRMWPIRCASSAPTCWIPRALATSFSSGVRNLHLSGLSGIKKNVLGAVSVYIIDGEWVDMSIDERYWVEDQSQSPTQYYSLLLNSTYLKCWSRKRSPLRYSHENTWQPFGQEKQSPVLDTMRVSTRDTVRKSAGKTGCQWCTAEEDTNPETEFAAKVEEW